MKRFKYLIFVAAALASCCNSDEVESDQSWGSWRQDTDKSIQRIFEILEKFDRMLTNTASKQFLPQCTEALKRYDLKESNNCWKDFMNQLKIVNYSTAQEIQILGQLIQSYCDDDKPCYFPILATFIENNVKKGSKLAIGSYNTLLEAMNAYGYLFLNNDSMYKLSRVRTMYPTLIKIKNAEGDASPIFTQTLPSVVNTILSGKEVYIRNNATGDYLYSESSGSGDSETNILVSNVKDNSTRYIWKLKPVEETSSSTPDQTPPLTFHIVNLFENKTLTINDKSVKLNRQCNSFDTMYYIRFFQGSSGEEVVIQSYEYTIEYTHLVTLGLEENEEGKVLKWSTTFVNTPTAVWLLQPKEQETY